MDEFCVAGFFEGVVSGIFVVGLMWVVGRFRLKNANVFPAIVAWFLVMAWIYFGFRDYTWHVIVAVGQPLAMMAGAGVYILGAVVDNLREAEDEWCRNT